MLRGLYTAASGMMAQLLQNDAVANNLANINTTGFKSSTVPFGAFNDVMVNAMSKQWEAPVGMMSMGSVAGNSHINFESGDMVETGNPMDVAIRGEGFISVQLPSGELAYTRNGQLAINGTGTLINNNGYPVVGESGPITIPTGTTSVVVKPNGEVVANGNAVGKIRINQFDDLKKMEPIGQSLFKTTQQATTADPKTTLEQGKLERSNANAISSLLDNINGLRAYEMMQRSIHIQDQTLQKVINDVGKPR